LRSDSGASLDVCSGRKKGEALYGLVFLLLVLTSFSPCVFPAQAQTSTPLFAIEPPMLEVTPGQSFNVSIYVDPGGRVIKACEVELDFDPSVMEVSSVEAGGLLDPDPIIVFNEVRVKDGTGRVIYGLNRTDVTDVPTPPGNLVILTFRVLDEAAVGKYNLTLVGVGLTSEEFVYEVDYSSQCLIYVKPAPPIGAIYWVMGVAVVAVAGALVYSKLRSKS